MNTLHAILKQLPETEILRILEDSPADSDVEGCLLLMLIISGINSSASRFAVSGNLKGLFEKIPFQPEEDFENSEVREEVLEEVPEEDTIESALKKSFVKIYLPRESDDKDYIYIYKGEDMRLSPLLFDKLFEKTKDFDRCLALALSNPYISAIQIKAIFDKTTDFSGCLRSALVHRPPKHPLIEQIFEKTKNFDECFLMAIRAGGYTWDFLYRLAERTTSFKRCLWYTLAGDGATQKLLDFLFDRTENFDGCFLNAVKNRYPEEFICRLFDKTSIPADAKHLVGMMKASRYSKKLIDHAFRNVTDFSGYLEEAVKDPFVSQYFFDFLFDRTENFDGNLLSAIDAELLRKFKGRILKKTICFENCLSKAINSQYPLKFLRGFLEKTGGGLGETLGGTTSSFYTAMKHRYTQTLIGFLFEKCFTGKFVRECLIIAIAKGFPRELIDFLFEKTTNFNGILRNVLATEGVGLDNIRRIIEKTSNFYGCLFQAIASKYPVELLDCLFEKTSIFEKCLFRAIISKYPVEVLDRLFEKTKDFKWCLESAIESQYPIEVLDRLFEKTEDFSGCLEEAVCCKDIPIEFMYRLLDKNDQTGFALFSAIQNSASDESLVWNTKNKVHMDFLMCLLNKTVVVRESLEEAIFADCFPEEFLDILLSKGRKSRYVVEGYEKYCYKKEVESADFEVII